MSKNRATNKDAGKGWAKIIVVVILTVLFGYFALNGFDAEGNGSVSSIKQGLDLAGGVSITYETVKEAPTAEEMADTVYKLQKRVEHYSTEAEVRREGERRITVNIPGVTNANAILEELGNPGSLTFTNAQGEVLMTGDMVTGAQAGYTTNQTTGATNYLVQLTLNEEGATLFADLTRQYLKDYIYIIYDGEVVSAPIVNDVITGGQCSIENISSFEAADNLATTIRIGSLPLELTEARASVVGAKLGQDAIRTSLIAGGIGLLLVMILMIVIYRVPGIAASLALAMYTCLVILLLAGFEMTLTLSGIAGIILGIGMAVDANVIIFARIREEVGRGNGIQQSIKNGFHKALSAILDGNITTLIVAVILILMGSGTVKGFAEALAIGIVVSMFTALVITRLMLNGLYQLGLRDRKYYGEEKHEKKIDFVGNHRKFFTVSGCIIAIGIIVMIINSTVRVGHPLNYGLEFVGGTSTNVSFPEELTAEQANTDLVKIVQEAIPSTQIETQKVQGTNEVVITTRALTADERSALANAMTENYQADQELITSDSISASVSQEMKNDAILSIIIATICMLLYIWFRFKDIRFGASAIVCLLHDVLVVVTCYAIAKWSVGNSFIACILTIVGYSINATIVIFDRIREHLNEETSRRDLDKVVNDSVNETLTRSIYTSLTTFITVTCLFILGVSSMREFALPLMIGIICGGYSSVCLAGSIWLLLRKKFVKKVEG